MPAATIKELAGTPDGYLWVATSAGLARFDGVRFTVFTTNAVPELGDDRILSLLVDPAGDLWVGTEGGTLARRQRGTFVAVPLDGRIGQRPLNSLASDHAGGIWLATGGAGLVHWSKGVCDFSALTTGLADTNVLQVLVDAQGHVWARCSGKIHALSERRWTSVILPPNSGRCGAMAAGRDGTPVCGNHVWPRARGKRWETHPPEGRPGPGGTARLPVEPRNRAVGGLVA